MDEPKSVSRRYSDREIALILTRTAEMQATRAAESEITAGLTQDELEQIAREAGLDPRYVRSAISELDAGRGTRQSRWLGGSTWIQLERSVAGEVPQREYEALVEMIQQTLGEAGQPSVLGRTLRWIALTSVSGRHAHGREVEVAIAARDGQTTIRIQEKLRAFATNLFLPAVLGGGSTAGILAGVLGGSLFGPVGGIIGGVAALGGSYAVARGIFGAKSRSRAEQLRGLIERLAEHIAATADAAPDDSVGPSKALGEGRPRELRGGGEL